MGKVTFNGDTKLITILTGYTNLDVQIDLYSDWKEWVLENPQWESAFRTFGGDPTTTDQFAPRYFFLTNLWKVVAHNVSTILQTNLYSDDYDSPFIIENAAITNRNSDAPIVKSEIEQRLDYADRIYYDETSPYDGIAYPVGTIAQPVNNIWSAITIANKYNIKNIFCLSDVDLTGISGETFDNWRLIADRQNLTVTIYNNVLTNMSIVGFTVDVDFGGGTTDMVVFSRGAIKHTSVLALGGDNLTYDIAVGLRTPKLEAEKIKIKYGCALCSLIDKNETVDVPGVGGRTSRTLSRRILGEILEPRVEEIFSLVYGELERSGYEDRITSGGSHNRGVCRIARCYRDGGTNI